MHSRGRSDSCGDSPRFASTPGTGAAAPLGAGHRRSGARMSAAPLLARSWWTRRCSRAVRRRLDRGLVGAGVEPTWATRPPAGDRQELPLSGPTRSFYAASDQARWLPSRLKPLARASSHAAGLDRCSGRFAPPARRRALPVGRRAAARRDRDGADQALVSAGVLTVTTRFRSTARRCRDAAGRPSRPDPALDRVIVHTRSGRQSLIDRECPREGSRHPARADLRLPEIQAAAQPRDPR